jgi:uncharacterized protein (TIGR02145 family)
MSLSSLEPNFILSSEDWRSSQNDNLWQSPGYINNPCPTGWHIPAQTEWNSLISAENITNYNTAFSSSLKLSVPGYRSDSSGSVVNSALISCFLSSSLCGSDFYYFFLFSAGQNTASSFNRSVGTSVRCLKN